MKKNLIFWPRNHSNSVELGGAGQPLVQWGWMPPKEERDRLRWVRRNSEVLKIFFAVAAGLFALAEYRSKDYADRVKTTAEVIDKFRNSDDYRGLDRLAQFWASKEIAQGRAAIIAGNIDSAREYRMMVYNRINEGHVDDLRKAIRGLNSVSMCGIQGACERSSICMQLAQTVQDLRCNFSENIIKLSEINGSCVVDEMNFFVDTYCRKWIAAYLGVPRYNGIQDNRCLFSKGKTTFGNLCSKSIIYKEPGSFLTRLLY